MSLIFDNLKSLQEQEQEPDWQAVAGSQGTGGSAGSWRSRAGVALAVLAVGVAGAYLFWPEENAGLPAMAQSETVPMTPVSEEAELVEPALPEAVEPVAVAEKEAATAAAESSMQEETGEVDATALEDVPEPPSQDSVIAAVAEPAESADSSSPLSAAGSGASSGTDDVIDVVETVGNDSGTGSVTMTVRTASDDESGAAGDSQQPGRIEITRADSVTDSQEDAPVTVTASRTPSGTVGTEPLPESRRPDVPDRQQVEAMRSRLLLALEAGQNEQARQVLEQLDRQLGRDSAFVRRMRAYYLMNSGQFAEAEVAYDQVLVDNPQDAEARLNSGWLALQRNDLVKARNRLRPLLTDDRFGAQANAYMSEIQRQSRTGL